MARPKKSRYVCNEPAYDSFSPNGISSDALQEEVVVMSVDEYEVFRLLDFEQITQQECAMQMKVARTTITEIYNQSRSKIADAIVNGKKLMIEGGNYELCEKAAHCCGRCGRECNGCKKECRKKEQEK